MKKQAINMRLMDLVLRIRDVSLRMPNDTSQSLEGTKLFPLFKNHPAKWIVDVGANDGFNLSNSNIFIQAGWNALLIEPIPSSLNKAKIHHGANPRVFFEEVAISNTEKLQKIYLDKSGEENVFATLETAPSLIRNKYVGTRHLEVQTKKLDSLLSKHRIPSHFALLSIDVEGHEVEVLETLGKFRPSLILVERNLSFLQKALLKQKILTDLNYVFVSRIGCNEVWVDSRSQYILERINEFQKISSIGI